MEYSDEFSRMQLEALERLREMQKRSKTYVEPSPPVIETPAAPEMPVNQSGATYHFQEQRSQHKDPISNLLSGFNLGSDKLLILLILFILYKNNADLKLLLALGYLLL